MKSIVKRKFYYSSPKWLKELVLLIPTSLKIGGKTLRVQKKEISNFEILSTKQKQSYVIHNINKILSIAKQYEFYNEYYSKNGRKKFKIRTLEEFEEYPILDKELIKNSDFLNEVKLKNKKYYEANTGGSSGEPFSFMLPNNIYSKLWAYKESVWKNVGYKIGDGVLSLRGHNFKTLYEHQTIYNFYYVNSNKLNIDNLKEIIHLLERNKIEFLHGYPSNLLRLVGLLNELSIKIKFKGVFTASEYISQHEINILESTFGCPIISIYEQSESSIFAHKISSLNRNYQFNLTYGLPQFKPIESDLYQLIGTSFLNTTMPFIRYQTGDLISIEYTNDNWDYTVKDIVGRVSEKVEFENKSYSLTGIIYGQHLPIFNYVQKIQVFIEVNTFYLIYQSHQKIPKKVIQDSINMMAKSLPNKVIIQTIQVNNLLKSINGKHKLLLSKAEYDTLCKKKK